MSISVRLRRVLFPAALIVGVTTAPAVPVPPLAGASSVAVGMVAGGTVARAAWGIGLGWLSEGARDRSTTHLPDLDRPVVVGGDLGGDRGRDRWGRWRYRLRVRSVRQGQAIEATRMPVELLSEQRLAVGTMRVKGYLRARPDGSLTLLVKHPRLVSDGPNRSIAIPAASLRSHLRTYADARVEELVPDPRRRALLRSMFFGRTQDLPEELRIGFRRLGLGHLFAVSGLHVGILAAAGWMLLARGRSWVRRLFPCLLVGAYALMLEPRGSVLRAVMVLMIWQAVELFGRRLDPVATLATCVGVLVLLDPGWVRDLGLRLSVLAVLGILLVGVPLAGALTPRLSWPGGLLGIGLGAQIATAPLSASTFHWLAPLGPLFGVVAVPWAALVLTLTLLALLAPFPGIAVLLHAPLNGLLAPGAWVASLPPHSLDGFPVRPWQGSVYASGMLLLAIALSVGVRRTGSRAKIWTAATIGVLAVGTAVVPAGVTPASVADTELVMLDVGQGDALLLRADGEDLLIDGGSDPSLLLLRMAEQRVRSLDVLLISHPDRDHCRAAADLARWIPVREVWTSSGWNSDCYWDLLALPSTRLRPLWAGWNREWRGLQLSVLAPGPAGTRLDNDDSLVLGVASASHRVLLTGDVEYRGERKLLRRTPCAALESGVLKVAHHGGKTSTGQSFLDCASPQTALISVGARNAFGHPVPAVLDRLVASGVDDVFRTDRDGTVSLRLD